EEGKGGGGGGRKTNFGGGVPAGHAAGGLQPDSRYSTSCRLSVIGAPGELGAVVILGGTPEIAARTINGCEHGANHRQSPGRLPRPQQRRSPHATPSGRARCE